MRKKRVVCGGGGSGGGIPIASGISVQGRQYDIMKFI